MSIIMLKNVLTFKADAIFTAALAAVMLLLGYWVKGKSSALRKYCIPAPVVGGFLFMFITFIGHQTGAYGFKFDTYFQDPFMLAFFTTVGLGASITLLKKGGALLIIYWLVSGIVSICQNIIGIAFSKIFGIEAPYALLASAISMIGGHGAAAAYGKTFVSMGYPAGLEVGMAAATFGLISAVLVGGPVARMLIEKYHLEPDPTENFDTDVEKVNAASQEKLSSLDIIKNVTAILCCMAIGSMISGWIGKLIHMSFPTYVGAMFTAVILRNLNEKYHFYQFNFSLVDGIGDVMLNLYLAIALMTLRLWELSGLQEQVPSPLWLPLSRSYGYILPSSLTRVLPRTLGFSPRIPVSVYGTGGSFLTRSFSRQRRLNPFGNKFPPHHASASVTGFAW